MKRRRRGIGSADGILGALCLCCAMGVMAPAAAEATGFAGLGILSTNSGASNVALNGVVVGWSGTGAFRWTQATGMVGLGAAADAYNRPIVSGNGLVVAGSRVVGGTPRMYRWTAGTGPVSISPAGAECYRPSSISSNGSAVTALGSSPAPYHHHCRWTAADGFDWLEGLPEVGQNHARNMVNLAGTAVVGVNHVDAEPVGFQWTATMSYVLCNAQAEGIGCSAVAENQAADVVIGTAGPHAFRWTVEGGRVDLGDLAGGDDSSAASALDETGARVVGWGSTAAGHEAMIWDAAHGIRRVADLLAVYNVVLPTDWRLRETTAISPDGHYLAGIGDHDGRTEAWRVELASLQEIIVRLRRTVQGLPKTQIATTHRVQLVKWLNATHVAALLADRPTKFQPVAQQTLRKLLLAIAVKVAPARAGGWIGNAEAAASMRSQVQDGLLWAPETAAQDDEPLPVATQEQAPVQE